MAAKGTKAKGPAKEWGSKGRKAEGKAFRKKTKETLAAVCHNVKPGLRRTG